MFGKAAIGVGAVAILLGAGSLAYLHRRYSRLIDEKLAGGPFVQTSQIFAAPRTIAVGDAMEPGELLSHLRRAGYGESRANRVGWYHVRSDAIEIFPGRDAWQNEAAVVRFQKSRIVQIVSANDHTERTQYQVEPELVTSLSDRNREKRRLVNFEDLPQVLVQAVISAEDKRFFHHAGFDPLRIVKAAYVDLREGRKQEGASTLSMQLARSFWLHPHKTWRRKIEELFITVLLEQRLTKEQIFEYYCNQINLGRRGSFAVHGFGQAAQAFFGKDVRQINLPEAAMLAGLIQSPSFYNPFRHPERMQERRNLILSMMRQNGFLDVQQYQAAAEAPLGLSPGSLEATEAPYFVDLVNEELQARFQDHDFKAGSYRIYTTLDINLQNAASEAVRVGMANVDDLLKKSRRHRGKEIPEAQVALIALSPQTGEVRALIGGRNYGTSQLNHVTAKRPPGSIFKPFVYAAALNTALSPDAREVVTPVTRIMDEPTTFWYDEKPYEPENFGKEFHGEVTVRQALAKSINIPAVKLAEIAGYEKVAALAREAGMTLDTAPTPALALGAHGVTPIEMAGAWTTLGNGGYYSKPHWISLVRAQDGSELYRAEPEMRQVLDPRITYMMVSLLEEVTRSGTAAGIRGRGFTLPAAGKTGTAHDGWFAGFTQNLLCIVWVGFDDYRELGLEGGKAALPIWTEFMKRAVKFKEYRSPLPFEAPEGVVVVPIDPLTGAIASTACPRTVNEVFIAGTEPVKFCYLHGGQTLSYVSGWDQPVASATSTHQAAAPRPDPVAKPPLPERPAQQEESPAKRRGFFGRLLGVFR
ncbi:MAG: PBP1A family penicillin-binding protein [Bryobacterales bacterium]|nr:PBP1A family penicillin-binding protein [Bryobacterales bacterium]